MTLERVVVVTGVSGTWGGLVAQALLAQPGLRVLGIDSRPLQRPIKGLDFVKADVRNPLLVDLLRIEQVDTVVHLAWRERQLRRESNLESNLLGTMQLLGACVDARVSQVVLRSTTAVYGAQPENPLYLTEDFPATASSGYACVSDAVEVERFLSEFGAEFPELLITTLRLANVVGASIDTPFTRLLRLPVIPGLLGFDPLLQVIDADDAVMAFAHCVERRAGGPYNVAADGVISLCQAAGMVGKPVLPLLHLAAYWSWSALAAVPGLHSALRYWPLEPDYLRFSWVASVQRMRTELGFEPAWTAQQTMERFVRALRVAQFASSPEMRAYADDGLDVVIEDRQRPEDSQ